MSRHIEVTPSVFTGAGKPGDFSWMIDQAIYHKALFIFNDNESQFENFLSGIAAGGGNAAIRPHQVGRPRAAGIPTGPNYLSLTPHAVAVIGRAVERIRTLLETGAYDQVIFSADSGDADRLGHGIFQVGDDVLRYIPAQIRQAAQAAEASLNS